MLDSLFLICTLRVGLADETGWHLWIFLLDLDQLAPLFLYAGFAVHLDGSIPGGFSERGWAAA